MNVLYNVYSSTYWIVDHYYFCVLNTKDYYYDGTIDLIKYTDMLNNDWTGCFVQIIYPLTNNLIAILEDIRGGQLTEY